MSPSPSRTLVTLTVSYALGLSAAPLVVMVGGLVGRDLAPTPALSTLPIAAMIVGAALGSAPAALWMRRAGRRAGFASGAALSAAACLLAAAGITSRSFGLFSAASLLLGVNLAFVMQHRFAAAEAVGGKDAARAVSLVLAGGIVGGVLGPEIGQRARDLTDTPWAGSFVAMALLHAALAVLILVGLAGRHRRSGSAAGPPGGVRPAPSGALLRNPRFVLAVAVGMCSYAVMTPVMTATPLAMSAAGLEVDATALVIQAHVVGMYLPSLVSGALIARIGVTRLLGAGLVVMGGAVAVGLSGGGLGSWIAALALVGFGWNFLYVGGTVALARAYPDRNRFRAQALNDGMVYTTQAAASLSAGVLFAAGGWTLVNLVVLAPLGATALLVVTLTTGRSAALHGPTPADPLPGESAA